MAGLAFSAAPILGGLLLEQDLWGLSWRSVFLINLPVGVPALAAGTVLLSESRAERRPPPDLGGVAIVTTGLLLVLFPLIQGNDLGWPAWTFLMMAAALPVLASFVWYERRKERRGLLPLVPVSLRRRRSFVAGLDGGHGRAAPGSGPPRRGGRAGHGLNGESGSSRSPASPM